MGTMQCRPKLKPQLVSWKTRAYYLLRAWQGVQMFSMVMFKLLLCPLLVHRTGPWTVSIWPWGRTPSVATPVVVTWVSARTGTHQASVSLEHILNRNPGEEALHIKADHTIIAVQLQRWHSLHFVPHGLHLTPRLDVVINLNSIIDLRWSGTVRVELWRWNTSIVFDDEMSVNI